MKRYIRKSLCLLLACLLTAGLCGCSFSRLAQDVAMQKIDALPTAETPAPSTEPEATTKPETTTPPANADAVAGEYQFYSMSDGTDTYFASDLDGMLDELELDLEKGKQLVYMKLNEDGSGVLSAMDIEGDILWDDAYLWVKDDPTDRVPYTYENNKLTFSTDGISITLEKIVVSL